MDNAGVAPRLPNVADLAALLVACVAATDTPIAVTGAGDDFPLIYVNAAFEKTTGYPAAQVLGRSGWFLHGPDTSQHTARALADALRSGRAGRARLLAYRPDGSTWWNDLHVSPVRDTTGAVTHFIGVQHDITDQVAAEQAAAHAATHDPLTGLANRVHFAQQLDRELARAARARRSVAVLFCDVDHLKATNDIHGHAIGDALLVEAAHRLRARLRGQDLAARHGGDEFLALLGDLPGDGSSAAASVVADLARAMAAPFQVEGTAHRMSVSIGMALFPRDGQTADELIAHADAAMYREKTTARWPPRPA